MFGCQRSSTILLCNECQSDILFCYPVVSPLLFCRFTYFFAGEEIFHGRSFLRNDAQNKLWFCYGRANVAIVAFPDAKRTGKGVSI